MVRPAAGGKERDMMMNGWGPQSTVVTCHPLINDDTCIANFAWQHSKHLLARK